MDVRDASISWELGEKFLAQYLGDVFLRLMERVDALGLYDWGIGLIFPEAPIGLGGSAICNEYHVFVSKGLFFPELRVNLQECRYAESGEGTNHDPNEEHLVAHHFL